MSSNEFLRALADPSSELVASGLTSLSSMAPEEASLLSEMWADMDLRRRQRLLAMLTELAEDSVELDFDAVFLIALADADPAVRRSAVRGLWEHGGSGLIDSLVELLERDPDASVRAEAALALGRFVLEVEFGNVRGAPARRIEEVLRRVVGDSREVMEVRGRALESVGARSRTWARELIQEAFEDSDRRLRLSAVHAMGRSCDAAWLPDVIAELESDDAEMRFEAAGACGAIADERATSHLLRLLEDDDPEVQDAAIGALGEIGGAEAKEALHRLLDGADERTREAAVSALAEIDFAEDPLSFQVRG